MPKSCSRNRPKAQTPPKKGNFYKKNGLIYRRAGRGGQEHARLIVPSSLRAQMLKMAHEIMYIMEIAATTQRISCLYYWPGVNADILRFVKY